MAVGDYLLKVPVEVTGKDQLQQLFDAMKGVSGATRGLTQDQLAFVTRVRESSALTGDLGKALRNVQNDFKGTSKEVRELSTRIQTYVTQMRAAEAQTNRLKRASEAQTNRLQQVAGRLGGRLGGIASGVPGGGFLGSQLVGSLGLSGSAALGVGAGAIGAFAVLEITKQVEELGKWAQANQAAASAIGVTATQMELLSRVSERTGVNVDGAAKKVADMQEVLIKGGAGADRLRESLSNIGLTGATAFKNPLDGLNDIEHALAKIPEGAQRTQASIQIFGDEMGRQMADLATTWDSLSTRVGKGLINADQLERLKNVNQAFTNLHDSWTRLIADAAKPIIFSVSVASTAMDIASPVLSLIANTARGIVSGKGYDTSQYQAFNDILNRQDADAANTTALNKRDKATKTDADLKAYQDYGLTHGTYQDQKAAQIEKYRAQEGDIAGNITSGKITLEQGEQQRSKLESQIKASQEAAKEAARKESELRSQREAFSKLTPYNTGKNAGTISLDDRDAMKLLQEMPTKFAAITNDPQYKRLYGDLASGFLPRYDELGRPQPGPYSANSAANMIQKQTDEKKILQYAPLSKEDRELQLNLRQGGQLAEEGLRSSTSLLGADASQTAAIRSGRTRLQSLSGNYSPDQIAGKNLQDELAQIKDQLALKLLPLNAEQGTFKPGSTEYNNKQNEIDAQKIEAENKAIESLNKFDEALADTTKKVRDEFSSGFASILMGAQNGAMHGQAGQGAKNAVRSIVETQESTILKNVGTSIFNSTNMPHVSASNPLAKYLQGTMFGPRTGDPQQEAIKGNTDELHTSTITIQDLIKAIEQFNPKVSGQQPGLTDYVPSLPGVTYGALQGAPGSPSLTPSPDTLVPGLVGVTYGQLSGQASGSGSGSLSNTFVPGTDYSLSDVVTGATAASSVASLGMGISLGATAAKDTTATGKAFGSIASAFGGTANVGNFGLFSGQASPFGTQQLSGPPSFDENGNMVYSGATDADGNAITATGSTSSAIGAGAADVAAGAAAVGGILTAVKGGAKNVISGISTTLAAIAPFTGPAAPFIEAAAAVGGLVSSFMGDPKAIRGAQIQKTLFTQQYLAPQAINLNEGSNGGYTDVDAHGNVRTSNFSPYPVVSNSYLDVPRRTTVPGHTISSFGGYTNATGAKTPPGDTHITINAVDTQSFAQALNKSGSAVLDAAHGALQKGAHPIVNTLGQQLGTR